MFPNLCSNYNISNLKNQACIKNISKVVPSLPYQYGMDTLTKCDASLLNYLRVFSDRFSGNIFPSQSKMAEDLGYCRTYINERIGFLCDLQMIFKRTRFIGKNKKFTNYKLSPFILNSEIKNLLTWSYKIFKQIVLCWAAITEPKIKNPTLLNVSYFTYFTNTLLTSNTSLEKSKSSKYIKINEAENSKRKEIVMEAQNTFNVVLTEAKSLAKEKFNLSQHGIVSIHVLDDEAIVYALNQTNVNKGKKNEDKFLIFCKIAHNYSRENNIARYWDERQQLESLWPIPASAKMTSEAKYVGKSSRVNKVNKIEGKRNYNIIYHEPLPGLPESEKAKIRERQQGTYVPKVETREKDIANVDRFLKSEQGLAMQQVLGKLTNPFIEKEKEAPKGTKNNKPMMQNLQGILNSLKTNEVKPQEHFNSDIEEEYSETEMLF